MNTLCKTCRHVDLLGHHKCYEEGDPVRVRQTTPAVLRMDMLEHYGFTPATEAGMVVKASPKPFDSAVRHIPFAIETIVFGDRVYGDFIEVRNLSQADTKRIRQWAKRVSEAQDKAFAEAFANWSPSSIYARPGSPSSSKQNYGV